MPQGNKSLVQYMVEGVYYYELLDERYKMTNDALDHEVERAFVDGFKEIQLADSIRAMLSLQGKRIFKIKDLIEMVKMQRWKQWNSEEYTRALEKLKASTSLPGQLQSSPESEELKSLVRMGQNFVSTMGTVNQNLGKVTDKLANMQVAGTSSASQASNS